VTEEVLVTLPSTSCLIDLSAIGFAGHGLAFKIALDEARISVG
jgi:hypothetical protein